MIRHTIRSLPLSRVLAYSFGASNLSQLVNTFYDRAAMHTTIRSDRLNYIKKAQNTVKCSIPLVRDNGTMETISGYRCQHKTHKLPTKGGTRFSPDCDVDEVEALALITTLQCTIVNLPYGGAKGGLKLDPKNYSEKQLERITRQYAIKLARKNSIGAAVDVPGPDIGTNEREMNWMQTSLHQYYSHQDINTQGTVTGKSMILGGVRSRRMGSGYGAFVVTKNVLENAQLTKSMKLSPGIAGKTFIVQGLGQMGYFVSKYLIQAGAKLIGVSQIDGSLYNPKGINLQALNQHFIQHKGVKGFYDADYTQKDEVIYRQCDIFIPAAKEVVMSQSNAHRFQCKLVVEGANLPATVQAEKICQAKGIRFVPDVLVGAGGLVVGYIQWLKNLKHVTPGRISRLWQEKSKENLLTVIANASGIQYDKSQLLKGATEGDIVRSAVQEVMTQASKEVIKIALAKKVDLRTAAYLNSITKLDEFYSLSGFPGCS